MQMDFRLKCAGVLLAYQMVFMAAALPVEGSHQNAGSEADFSSTLKAMKYGLRIYKTLAVSPCETNIKLPCLFIIVALPL